MAAVLAGVVLLISGCGLYCSDVDGKPAANSVSAGTRSSSGDSATDRQPVVADPAADLTADGFLYESNATYAGIFNPSACYLYKNDGAAPAHGYFEFRLLSNQHRCTDHQSDTWSGNWLNWAARLSLPEGDRAADGTELQPSPAALKKAFESLAEGRAHAALRGGGALQSGADRAQALDASMPFQWGGLAPFVVVRGATAYITGSSTFLTDPVIVPYASVSHKSAIGIATPYETITYASDGSGANVAARGVSTLFNYPGSPNESEKEECRNRGNLPCAVRIRYHPTITVPFGDPSLVYEIQLRRR